MLSSWLMAGSLVLFGQAQVWSASGGEDLTLALFVSVQRPGSAGPGMRAGDQGTGTVEAQVWGDAGLCSLAAGDTGPPSPPAFGWYLTGHVLESSGDEALVQIDWKRRFSDGTELAVGPQGALHVVMRRGDRVVLDSVEATDARCGGGIARVEAALSPFSEAIVVTPGGSGSSGAGAARGGRGPMAAASGRGAARTASQRAASGVEYLAEIWLVHTRPDGSTHVQMQSTAVGSGDRPFAFPPVRTSSGRGDVSVRVSGVLWVTPPDRGPAQVVVSLAREVRDAMGERVGDGIASKTIDLPPAGDVVSFELPPPRSGAGASGGRFSVRLRLSELTSTIGR